MAAGKVNKLEQLAHADGIEDALQKQGRAVAQLLRRRTFARGRGVDDGGEDGRGGAHGNEAGAEEDDYDPAASHRGFQAHPIKAARVALEWHDLTYTVRVGRGKKATKRAILDRVSGVAPPGAVLAIMGPTGSGKTSLVNALAGRLEGGELSGSIQVNGRDRTKSFKNISGYVMQDDVLLGILTVRETFDVAASLRLPRSMSKEAKSGVVDAIITELGLGKAADTRIGDAFTRGVSGGERKRVAFGQALLGNPAVLFLDEPTSGLDAFQAQNVMEALWRLAKVRPHDCDPSLPCMTADFGGRTVLSTIHQPRSSIFARFDLLLLISEGRLIYYGPANLAVEHFDRCHMACPKHFNPGDFLLDITSVDNRSPEAEAGTKERIQLLATVFEQDAHLYQVSTNMEVEDMKGLPGKFSFATDWFTQYSVLQKRALKQAAREKLPIIIVFVQMIVIGIILGVLYINMNYSFVGIQDRTGLFFFLGVGVAFGNMLGVVNVFPREKAMVFRERAAKSYRVSAYFISKLIADQPLRIISLLLYASIVYWMAGLRSSAGAFFKFFLIILLEAMCAGGMGLAISAACKSVDAANAIAPAAAIILILFGGFYANSNTIPKAVRWIQYLSHLYWMFVATTINEFRGACCWECPAGSAPGCTISGTQIVNQQLGFADREYWEGVVALLGLTAAWNLLGYWLLRRGIPKFLPLASTKAAEEAEAPPAASSGHPKTAAEVNGRAEKAIETV